MGYFEVLYNMARFEIGLSLEHSGFLEAFMSFLLSMKRWNLAPFFLFLLLKDLMENSDQLLNSYQQEIELWMNQMKAI